MDEINEELARHASVCKKRMWADKDAGSPHTSKKGFEKKDGKWVIVDLGKPDNPIIRFGVSLYLKTILPIIAYVIGGKLGLKFAALYETYRLWPQNRKLESLLNEKFSKIEFEKDLMGGAVMIAAYK